MLFALFFVVLFVFVFVVVQDDLALSSEAVLGLSYHDMSVLVDGLAKEMEQQGTGTARYCIVLYYHNTALPQHCTVTTLHYNNTAITPHNATFYFFCCCCCCCWSSSVQIPSYDLLHPTLHLIHLLTRLFSIYPLHAS